MEQPGGIGALGINWKFLVSQIVNFVVLLVILRFLLYKPILNLLNQRRKNIEDSQTLAEKTRKESAELDAKNKQQVIKMRQKAEQFREEAIEEANEEAKEINQKAQDDAKKISDKAHEEIKVDRERMIRDLKGELADLILLASDKLTKKTIKPEIQKQLVEDIISDLKSREL